MDKGKTCNTCRKLNESINEFRCEPCQATIEKTYYWKIKTQEWKEKARETWQSWEIPRKREKYREANLEKIKASKKEYSQIEIDCEFCECKVKKYRWEAHTETQKHKNNERIKKKGRRKAE